MRLHAWCGLGLPQRAGPAREAGNGCFADEVPRVTWQECQVVECGWGGPPSSAGLTWMYAEALPTSPALSLTILLLIQASLGSLNTLHSCFGPLKNTQNAQSITN